ncbi:MAG: hypothetical protein ABR500_07925 [Dermatophilaceae bacterium]|nr:hypothetical protein [Intrasporangiaceae bacterium]
MSRNQRAIVDDVQFVVDAGRDDTLRKVAYALYVAALLLVTYGVTLARAFFLTQDPRWLREQVTSWRGAIVLAVVVGVGLAAAWRTGKVRGPVLPPLPWIDLVAAGPVDRAITLRRWWLVALAGLVTGAAMLGAVVGGGAWLATVGDPGWLVIGAVLATALGWLHLLLWLAGQVSISAPASVPPVWRPREALRRLRLEDLRAQSARATRMGGAVLLGDLRAIRLEVATPVTRGRTRRLRPGRSWTVIPRRDLLGQMRQPGSGVLAALVTMVGAGGLTWALLYPAVPVVVAVACGLVLHLGFSIAAEGLRLQGDNAGTPSLLGLSTRSEAFGHLAVPLLLSGGTAVLTAAAVGLTREASSAYVLPAVGWMVLMVAVVLGTATASAFRGSAPLSVFLPEAGPIMLLVWVSRQAIVAAGAVGGLTASAARLSPQEALLPAVMVAMAAVVWGFRRVDAVAMEHRV